MFCLAPARSLVLRAGLVFPVLDPYTFTDDKKGFRNVHQSTGTRRARLFVRYL